MTTIKTNHGEYSGKSVGSIIRREYGREAAVEPTADPNSPHYGTILRQSQYDPRSSVVLGVVYWVEDDNKADALADLAAAVRESEEDLKAAQDNRNEAIRQAVAGGVTKYRVAKITGLTQTMVDKIVRAT